MNIMETIIENEKDVAKPDQIASGTAGTGQENEELEWARRHVPPDLFLAVRKTEIIGWGIRTRNKVRRKNPGEHAGRNRHEPGQTE
jgi:hypothetical protein